MLIKKQNNTNVYIMKKSEFLKEVLEELDTIKERATKEEIERLNFDNFNHEHTNKCIYGQMTRDCNSHRAKELYEKKYQRIEDDNDFYEEGVLFFEEQSMELGNEFTPLEKYLYMVESDKHKEVIDYLKKNIQIINL